MGTEQLDASAPSIENIVAIVRPNSPRLDEARAWLRGLGDSFLTAPPITVLETAAEPSATHERLARVQHQIGKTTLVAVLLGDGSTNQVMKWMVHPDTSPDVRQAQTLLLPSGTANDTALSLNQPEVLADPSNILDPRNRRLRELHPARMTIQNPDGEIEEHVVVSYAGGGSEGWGVVGLGKQRERLEKLKAAEAAVRAAEQRAEAWLLAKHHQIREFTAAVLPGFYKPTFTVEYGDQTYEDVFDLLLMNGPLIARYGRSSASHHEPIVHATMSRAPFGLAGRAPSH